jgi:hypothetical protein
MSYSDSMAAVALGNSWYRRSDPHTLPDINTFQDIETSEALFMQTHPPGCACDLAFNR